MIPVKAYQFLKTDLVTPEERAGLLGSGLIPVNNIFFYLWECLAKLHLLYGSYGSGKSDFIATWFIKECRKKQYFKGYFGRKIKDKVRESCHSKLVSIIERYNLQNEFKFSKEPNGTLDIVHRKTGNTLIPFGAQDPDDMKSVDDPTAIWMEEGDQFTDKDFGILLSRLRTPRTAHHLFMSFNTSAVFTGHWLLNYFFPELAQSDSKIDNEELLNSLKSVQITKTFCNYKDNYFIDQEAYYNTLVIAAGGNKMLLQAIANGAWGVIENGNPWLHAFKDEKHLRRLTFLPSYPVHLNFDFNVDPISCVASQMSPSKGSNNSFIHFIREFGGKVKVEDLCQQIKTAFPNSIFYFAGDRSGLNEDVGRNQTLYGIIGSFFKANDAQMNIQNYNLEHADSRMLCNAMFEHYPNIFIDPILCPNLVADCRKATCDPDSVKPSHLLKDRGKFKMDYFDGMRYFFQTYFNKWAKEVYFKVISKK